MELVVGLLKLCMNLKICTCYSLFNPHMYDHVTCMKCIMHIETELILRHTPARSLPPQKDISCHAGTRTQEQRFVPVSGKTSVSWRRRESVRVRVPCSQVQGERLGCVRLRTRVLPHGRAAGKQVLFIWGD